MFSLLHETDDSTTVNYSGYGKFVPGTGNGNQLVTIGGKYLRLFRTNPYALIPPSEESDEWGQKTKLECVFSFRLLNSPVSVAHANIPLYPGCESLLLAFDDAKLSIVAIDADSRFLRTLSLHSYEDEFLKGGNTKNFPPPIVKVDPLNRCAAMLVYGKHLAILPFNDSQHVKSFVVSLNQIDPRLDNVVDIAFLDGYYEPTLLFLYEPLQTTAGRASIRYDTMCIMGVSVNTVDKQFAVVWQLANLPMDGYRLIPIPKPVGGAVVFGANDVIYINQAVPPCGIMLNSCYDNFTKFPLKDLHSMAITLDAACYELLSGGNIAVGTNEGKLLVLSLVTDSASTVKSMTFKEICDISLPFCLTQCAPGHLFVGSRLGDSQLFRYTQNKIEENGNSHKKPRLENNIDEEDLELYGEIEENDTDQTTVECEEKWEFSELDRLTNVGPVKTMTAGGALDTSPLLLENTRVDPVFDIVTAAGHGKDGALCIMQRTVRPDVLTSSSLEGARQMWAVGQHHDGSHKYLIVSRIRSTLVLELGEEMVELEDPLFITSESTVAAGELADGGLVVQVTSMCLCLVADDQQVQEMKLDTNFPVVAASIVDPYVALLTQNGRLILFQLCVSPTIHLQKLSTTALEGPNQSAITSISIYKDMSGMMIFSSDKHQYTESVKKTNGNRHNEDFELYGDSAQDAEDLLLYGNTQTTTVKPTTEPEISRKRRRGVVVASAAGGEESDAIDPNTVSPTFWLIIARETGRVAIFGLPEMRLAYQMRRFCAMNDMYFDETEEEGEKDKREMAAEKERRAKENNDMLDLNETIRQEERIVELQIVGMGISQGHPILFAVIDDLLVAYEMFPTSNSHQDHLGITFKRMPLTVCLRSSSYMGLDGRRNDVQYGRDTDLQRTVIHPFDRIGGVMHGVFVTGTLPCLILYGAFGGLRHHPVTIDGAIRSFTPFNNENVANGFLYLTEITKELRISKLNRDFDYDLPYPCRKVPVDGTVHFVRYLMNSQIYAVVTSQQRKTNKIWVVVNDDKQEEKHDKSENFVLPSVHQFTLSLYSPENWQKIPNADLELQELEHVTACEEVALRSEATMSGLQTYLALGTINNYGEEHLVRGRIIIAEIIEVVPDPSMPTSKHKLKILYEAEQKMPVSAICAVNGFLLTGMGQKIFIWGFKDNELQGISFLDMHYYVHSLVGLRNMALACDMQSSMSLVRFQEQFKALSVASRDDRHGILPPMQAQYLVDHKNVAFIMTDEGNNLFMFSYMPELKDSVGGEKLTIRGVINTGTGVNALMRVKGHTSLCDISQDMAKVVSQQQSTLWASLDGSFGYVRPVSEKSFRRLSSLHQVMITGVRHYAGLNPKGARAIRPPRPVINAANHRNMIDGDVVFRFMHLSTAEKQDMARRLGASRYHIMDDLIQIQRLATYF